jgi:hypothetical protein
LTHTWQIQKWFWNKTWILERYLSLSNIFPGLHLCMRCGLGVIWFLQMWCSSFNWHP